MFPKFLFTNRQSTTEGGFTLIEILIYMALFSFVMGGMLFTVYGIIEGSGKIQSGNALNEEGLFIIKKLEWAMSGANDITVPSPNTLRIVKPSLPSGENPLVFTVDDDALFLARGTNEAVRLNNENIAVAEMVFTEIPPQDGKPAGASAEFRLEYFSNDRSFEITRYLKVF